LPLLLIAETIIDPAIRLGLGEFVDARIVPDKELPQFENILKRIQRLRNSAIPELILLALAFFPVMLFQREWTIGVVSTWHTTARGLSAAGWWFALFSAPLLRFILYRWAFRYVLWAILLWRISRLDLVLIPTHPDHAAGLGFLGMTQRRFGLLFCALAWFVAGRMANSMLFEGTPLTSFKTLMVGFVALSLIIGLLPLTTMTHRLLKVRREGILAYGRLANNYTESFDRKWVHYAEPPSEQLLGTGDIQSLADIGNSFGFVEHMKVAPISRRLVLQIAGQAALPLIPVIIFGTPTPQLVEALIKMLA